MRIHFFVRTLNEKNGGGSHHNSIAYIRALKAHGHTVVVHVFSGGGSNAFPPDIVPEVHDGWGLNFRRSRSYLAELLKQSESEADVFFLYAIEFAWGGGLYRRRGGKVPVVVYMDAYLPSMNNIQPGSFNEWLYHFKRLPWDKIVGLTDAKHIDRFLPCSPYIGEEYKKFGFPKDRFTVLPNIVLDQSLEKNKITHSHDGIHVLYAGRLIYEKGVDLLINALAELTEFSWKLTVVGDGPMRASLEEQIRKEHLPIEIVGWMSQEKLGEFYADADVFVHPARWPEPFGRTIVEALHAHLPVIVPAKGGSAWLAGDAGLIFTNGDVGSLASKLRMLLQDGVLRRELAAKSSLQAHRFSPEAVYPQLEKILQSIISSKR